MPQISFFYGIVILMNFADHAPAHFHAWYGDFKVIVSIKDGVVKGEMPGRALKMILEWLEIHREELLSNWRKAQNGMPLDKGVFYKLVFMFLSGRLFCLDDFGLSFASVSFSFSHDARIAPSFIRDICCMIASKSPQANL